MTVSMLDVRFGSVATDSDRRDIAWRAASAVAYEWWVVGPVRGARVREKIDGQPFRR